MSPPHSPPARPTPTLPRRLFAGLLWVLLGGYFVFAVLILALRLLVLPQIENYRPQLETLLGQALNRPVSIREVDAYWVGLHPALSLGGLDIRDSEGRSALAFERVETELAWDSLLFMQLRLARLEIVSPDLVLRRDSAGRLYAAGLELTPQADADGDFSDWLLAQHRIVIRDARLRWIDDMRGAPPLALEQVNFQLDNRYSRHRFGFTAQPPSALAAAIDIRGDFKGRDLETLADWKGEAYAELSYADLAGFQPWLDYPVALPQGRGALRLWLGFDQQRLQSATADVRLADVRLRLRPDLPQLELARLEGRLAGKRTKEGYALALEKLQLVGSDGLVMAPADITLDWRRARDKQPESGSARASLLDLDVLARLACHLPLDEGLRQRLAQHRPAGKLRELALDWQGPPQALLDWQIKSRFDGLAITAFDRIPGLRQINGQVEGNPHGGRLTLDGQASSLDLPTVFPEPRLDLQRFAAEASWRQGTSGLEVQLKKFSFENADAAGEARGTWRALAAGPGEIDLNARLTRANGTAVWRYMPLTVGKDARDWLRRSLLAGRASEVNMRLKGNLARFPFRADTPGVGKDEIFRVTGKMKDVRLAYAESWPEITGIDGELLFEGARMLISTGSGRIFGASVGQTRSEIADLEQTEELLTVVGRASGQTEDFLRFIEASPVGERIDHFTAPMQGDGRGDLEIKMVLPLRRMEGSRIDGIYRFDGNRLTVDADLPTLADVRGQLRFSADSLESRNLRATLLGAPLGIDIRTQKDGVLHVGAEGEIGIAHLRRRFDSPLLDHLAGSTPWSGTVKVRKRNAEVALHSRLIGISSSLPPPFNKSAADALPLRFERKAAPPARGEGGAKLSAGEAAPIVLDMLEVALGDLARLQLVRRHDTKEPTPVRAALALGGAAATLPERGLTVVGHLPQLDADFWRHTLDHGDTTTPATNTADDSVAAPLWQHLRFDVRADEVKLFDKRFRDIHLSGQRQGAVARFELKSPAVAGKFTWDAAGSGKLSGRLAELDIPETMAQPGTLQTEVGEIVEELPALDLSIGRLSFKGRALGSVTLTAENRDRYWNARFDLANDDSQLKGALRWRPDPARPETRLVFDLDSKDMEKTLARLGYAEGMRRGSALLKGQMGWRGAPTAIDYPSFAAAIDVEAANGQFTKLEPGVGRLLGVLSLQTLPRRITLDFRDVFSEGFAFDSIQGKFNAERGILHTDKLEIRGPSAKVLLAGDIDLAQETQNLKVKVQPAVGETLAVGAMIANPLAGAVAWVAQKLLKDPLDQAFAFDYAVTGNWKEPIVEKLGQTPLLRNEEKK